MNPTESKGNLDWLEPYNRVVRMYHKDSDRAAGVLAASYLDDYLKRRLEQTLVDHKECRSLFKGMNPLSSFKARTEIAFAVGLLSESIHDDLNLIREVRNKFAHHPDEISFETKEIKDLCDRLSTARGIPTERGEPFTVDDARGQFLMAVAINLMGIDQLFTMRGRYTLPLWKTTIA